MSQAGIEFIVANSIGLLAIPVVVVLAVLYMMALLLTEFMNNAAGAVLLTPIGMSTARAGRGCHSFLIAVTLLPQRVLRRQ